MTDCTIIAKPHPFQSERVQAFARAGQTIAQMLGDASHSCRVTVGGYEVPHRLWDRVRPKAGQTLHVEVFPQGGDSGKWIRAVLMIALIVVTYGYGAAAAGAFGVTSAAGVAAFQAGLMFVGTMAINALVPPPGLSSGNIGGASDPYDPLQQITGTQNRAVPYGTIPCVVGQARFYPTHAALPYTEISGNDQYLRMLLDLGHGDLDISDIKIGETPIGDFDDVEWEVSTTPTLFTQDIFELQVGTVLNSIGDNDTRVTQNPTNEISVDLAHGQGLFAINKEGKTVKATNRFTVEYRAAGSSDAWANVTAAPGLSLSTSAATVIGTQIVIASSAKRLLRVGIRWAVAQGQYEVRVTRGTSATGEFNLSATYNSTTWALLRSISSQNPSTTGTLKLAVRIKATDQLNGVISTLNCVAAQKVRRMDEFGEWLSPVASTNPAWVWLWLLTECPATVRKLTDDRIDLDAVAQWAAECEAKDYVVGAVADSGRNFGDLLRDVLACGRASFGVRNGKYAPIRDIAQVTPVQMFTPANSWGFTYSRTFIEPPHALRVKFKNPDQNGQTDVRTVYHDGYTSANATRFEDLDLRMVDQPDAAWRLARYHLAVMWGRQTQYSFNADMEHMVVERGDLIHVASDITSWGAAWGRVVAVDGLTVTLDGPVTLESGASYNFRVRGDDNFQDTAAITTAAGDHSVITLGATTDVAVGDLWVIGKVSQGVAKLIVRAIEPMEDMKASIVCVDAAPGVWTADAGTPPAFISEITGAPWCSPPEPPVVTIRPGNAAPDDGGTVKPQPGISPSPKPGIERSPVVGGRGGGCVMVDSLMPDGRTAGEVQVGDVLSMADPMTLEPMAAAVTYSEPVMQPCAEIITEGGARLRCSLSAPIPTPDGLRSPNDLGGRLVAVLRDGEAVWERVARIRGIGPRMVQHISVEDGCFWAGDADFILHHNKARIGGRMELY